MQNLPNWSAKNRDEKPYRLATRSISFITLGVVGGAFLTGVIVTIIVLKATNTTTETLSTTELINFLFGIALSAGSIALAIVAIGLGRSSEEAIVRRSDESIRIQNETFAKTIDALGRIESSTGVTERRIEDIISGRVGAISEHLAQRISEEQIVGSKSPRALQKEISNSLLAELSENPELKRNGKHDQQRTRALKQYKDFIDRVLIKLANTPGVKTLKIGSGTTLGEGLDLVDGAYEIHGRTVGVAVFPRENTQIPFSYETDDLTDYFSKIAREVAKGYFSKIFLVFAGDLSPTSPYRIALQERADFFDDIGTRIQIVTGKPEEVVSQILEKMQQIALPTVDGEIVGADL